MCLRGAETLGFDFRGRDFWVREVGQIVRFDLWGLGIGQVREVELPGTIGFDLWGIGQVREVELPGTIGFDLWGIGQVREVELPGTIGFDLWGLGSMCLNRTGVGHVRKRGLPMVED